MIEDDFISRRTFLGLAAMAPPALDQLIKTHREIGRKIREAQQLQGGMPALSERERDRARKQVARQAVRFVDVQVSTASLRRRRLLEHDIFRWLRHYFPAVFTYDFTAHQRVMIQTILLAARYGGDQAIAAPRGEGKTTITECVVTYCVLTGALHFPLIFAATGGLAERMLANIKSQLEDNDQLQQDYAEVCAPARELQGLPNRANGQMVRGKIGAVQIPEQRSRIRWSGHQIVLPRIEIGPSRARGQIIATRGLDAAVRGIRYGTQRPDLAVIDDPETREGAESEVQTEKLERKLDQDVAGLGGQTRRLSRVMLTTCMNRRCLSYKFTDPIQKASWKGRRFSFLLKPPDRLDLWDEYVLLCQTNPLEDQHCRAAHRFYLEHRDQMDAGATVGNPNRFDRSVLPDGSQLEVSALQLYFNEIARYGPEAVECEYQNQPPEETGPIESGITAHRVQMQTGGYPRRVIPPGCTVLTQGIDVKKVALHWVVRAWRPDATGYVIDYGVTETHGTVYGADEGVDVAIVAAIRARMEQVTAEPYRTAEDKELSVDLTLIDAHYRSDAVYHACREIGSRIMPAIGFGQSAGAVRTMFHSPLHTTIDRKPGDGWFLSRVKGRLWRVCMDTDRWKCWEHDRWMTPPDKPGTLLMWGEGARGGRPSDDQRAHHSYAHHIVAEVEVEELVRGVLVRRWKAKSDNNHWFDASYMSDVAAAMKGIKLLKDQPSTKIQGSWYAAQSRK